MKHKKNNIGTKYQIYFLSGCKGFDDEMSNAKKYIRIVTVQHRVILTISKQKEDS